MSFAKVQKAVQCCHRLISHRPASSSTIVHKADLNIGESVAASFAKQPERTASNIVNCLQADDRARLLKLLSQSVAHNADPAKAASSSHAAVPGAATLFSVAMSAGLPFIVFGFSDNAIMILAGDEIESTFGARLGLSTLAAAGLGNLLSDLVGLAMAEPVQNGVGRWMARTHLSTSQRQMWQTRVARLSGTSLGVTIGCLLGMTPLFFLRPHTAVEGAAKEKVQDEAG